MFYTEFPYTLQATLLPSFYKLSIYCTIVISINALEEDHVTMLGIQGIVYRICMHLYLWYTRLSIRHTN